MLGVLGPGIFLVCSFSPSEFSPQCSSVCVCMGTVGSASFKAIPYSVVATQGACPCMVRTCSKFHCGSLEDKGQSGEISKFHPQTH